MPNANYANQFEKLYNKAKAYDMILPGGRVAYKFRNSANMKRFQ